MKQKLIRISTVPISLDKLIEGQMAFMKNNYEVIAVSSGGDTLNNVSQKEGIRVVPIEMSRTITPLKDLKAVWQLYKLFKKEQPYIVHSHTPKAGIVAMLAAWMAGVPNRLHTVAGLPLLEATGFKRKVLNSVEKLTYACATKVYPNSKGLETLIIKHKFAKLQKLKVLANGSSNGIDTNYFNPNLVSVANNLKLRAKLNIQENDFVFIFVGRLVSDKGINELVQAFKQLQISNSKLGNSTLKTKKSKLVLVGPLETDLDPLLPETLKEITNNEDIISVGYQQNVRPYFAIANVLVFPSYREGFPNVVLQAGAMGLPSIVSNINGCNEIVIHEHNGIIIPVKNTNAIFSTMQRLIEDANLCANLQNNARKRIIENYEQKVVWEAILNEYKSLEENV